MLGRPWERKKNSLKCVKRSRKSIIKALLLNQRVIRSYLYVTPVKNAGSRLIVNQVCRDIYTIFITLRRPCHITEWCEKGFLHKSSYLRHLKQHEGIFNFTCQVCGKGFYNKSDLKGHLVSHGGHQEYICSCCGKQFAYRQGLHQHIKAAHQKWRILSVCTV